MTDKNLHCYDGPVDLGEMCMTHMTESELLVMRQTLKHTVSTSETGSIVQYDFDKCVVYQNGDERSVIWK